VGVADTEAVFPSSPLKPTVPHSAGSARSLSRRYQASAVRSAAVPLAPSPAAPTPAPLQPLNPQPSAHSPASSGSSVRCSLCRIISSSPVSKV
jgi:hypothetical protein